jgi:hypothetical protein
MSVFIIILLSSFVVFIVVLIAVLAAQMTAYRSQYLYYGAGAL